MPIQSVTPLDEIPFVVFDTETTGLNPDGDSVIEIAGIRVHQGTIQDGDMFHSLVNPVRPIPYDVQRIHGITDEEVAGANLFELVLPQFLSFVDDAVLVAHNAEFDMGFLNKTLVDMGWGMWQQPVVCTVLLSRALFPQERRHDLDSVARRLHLDPVQRHRAQGDVLQTAQAFLRFLEVIRAKGPATFTALEPALI